MIYNTILIMGFLAHVDEPVQVVITISGDNVQQIASEPPVSRESFNLVDYNRLKLDKDLRDKVRLKIVELTKKYNNNDRKIRDFMVKKEIIDWVYTLEGFIKPFSREENIELDTILNEPFPLSDEREYINVNIHGKSFVVKGWKDQNGKYSWYVHEQTPEIQAEVKQNAR